MRSEEIIRSWKDETYQLDLSSNERTLAPDNPAGVIELTDAEIIGIHGGSEITVVSYMPCKIVITVWPSAITFCAPTWGFCPL